MMVAADDPAVNPPEGSHQQAASPSEAGPDRSRRPGAQLKAAREAKGLTVDEVAESLRLHTRQIAALERDDYGYFCAPVFVIGYVRNYARLLDMDPEPLLAGLGSRAPKVPAVKAELTSTNIPMKRRRVFEETRWIIAGVAVIAVVLSIWAVNRHPRPANPQTASAESGAAMPAAPTQRPQPTDAPAADATAISQPNPPPDGAAANPESVPAPPAAVHAASKEATPAPGTKPQTKAPEAKAAPAKPAQVVLRLKADSWIEIADAAGERLVARMGKAGDEVKLHGQPPFDVLLGNASNVEVEYNGKPYRDMPISKQNVANFKLGKAGD
jgi:cytoskeleton protein RodZ